MSNKIWEFEIPHVGWEMDNQGWIEESDGKLSLFTTNHGCITEMTSKSLDEKIAKCTEWRAGLMKARDVIEGK